MSSTPPLLKTGHSSETDLLGAESWIEVSTQAASTIPKTPDRVTPLPFASGDEYLRLLREAQRESNQSSRVVSLSSSRRDSPKGTPKSPPNSPNTEFCTEEELNGIYINYWNKINENKGNKNEEDTEWIWEYSSRPDSCPPKGWGFSHQGRTGTGYSMRSVRVGKNSLFSREVVYSFLLTNMISCLFGLGIGIWLTRKGYILKNLAAE